MDGYTLNDILATKTTTTKKKQAKRLWREIEEIQDRRQLLHELKELDPFFNGNLDDVYLK
ncbi:DUF3545 family protein [Aliivibrio fischeri]|uniref:DUF3545 family protein n=4 Tax=Aliivibrio fischeri TaxID=668 RepID=Q5E2Z0_ALIF1|nr:MULTISPECIES: DUF3545 family protein [Aliivibrio]AAW86606.1 hypothetical protein VF_2111 [Aliivibrio fischeri ES114]ACH66730.1 conserved hypothetical protein [Aliivibrio fischeri MJ11]EHN70520.1 hypothetical protein VFSR5_2178 [Aliivibrio fischeri SR5]KLU79111.1 hypothetical protein AB192_06100 [Aliivibrio fischeri]MBD1568926.1 DUF3545 family protein [Aliivibrio sp. S10_S31]